MSSRPIVVIKNVEEFVAIMERGGNIPRLQFDEELWPRIVELPENMVDWATMRAVFAPGVAMSVYRMDLSPSNRWQVIGRRGVTPEELDEASYDNSSHVRARIAGHPDALIETVNRLARDPDGWVRQRAMESLSKRK